uniref:CCHC-type domain-containing protein n=1 Tax=Cannabis sativa TaxID=3483 RepID=A0A803P9P2_CANSA
MAKRAKMAGKGKSKGKKTGPSSLDRVIKTRSMDVVLGIQELEVEEADESIEQCQKPMEQYIEKIFSPEESEALIIRQSLDTGKAEVKKTIKIDFDDIADEVNYWQPSLVCYVIGANPSISILEGFVRRLWKDEVVKPWNPIEDFTKEEVTNVPTLVQLKGLDIKYWGETSLFKIVGQLGEPLQVDNVTKNRDRLQYPRILIQVSLAQEFPEKISFIDEFDHEVELDVKYEWLPLVCYNCSGIGHKTSECRKKEEKKEAGKQVWMPKKITKDEGNQIDGEGFQKVNKGKKVTPMKESERTTVRNMSESLSEEPGNVEEVGIEMGITEIGNENNTRGEGDPSSSNG